MKKILVVDDDLITIKIVANFLEDKYELFSETTFKDASKLIENSDFDIFLLDISLNDGDGIDLFKLIKKQEKFRFTPVIFITSHSEIDYMQKVFSYGADDYIIKPINLKELSIRIQRRLDVSLNQKKLYHDYNEINEQLLKLSDDFKNEDSIFINEESLMINEKRFQENSKKIDLNIQNSIKFSEKIEDMKSKLIKQKNLIDEIKKFLD